MNRDLTHLYQTVLLQHDRTPFHYQKVENAPIAIAAYNPLCGDQFQLFLTIKQDIIQEAHFYGYGCTISKASTSVLIKKIQGLPVSEIPPLFHTFLQIVTPFEADLKNPDEELNAFAAARQFPERLQCATLSWEALRSFFKFD